VLLSGLWRLLRAVGTAKARSAGMRRTAPGWVLSRSAGARTDRGSDGRSPGVPKTRGPGEAEEASGRGGCWPEDFG